MSKIARCVSICYIYHQIYLDINLTFFLYCSVVCGKLVLNCINESVAQLEDELMDPTAPSQKDSGKTHLPLEHH